MRGKVFLTSIDHLHIEPHPHLVVILSGKMCLVVPGYTAGKYKITEKIDALKAMGYREDQVCVHMDNAKYLTNCVKGFTPRPATWFTWQGYWADKKTYENLVPKCEMNAEGQDIIARAMLTLHEANSSLMSEKEVAHIKQWIRAQT